MAGEAQGGGGGGESSGLELVPVENRGIRNMNFLVKTLWWTVKLSSCFPLRGGSNILVIRKLELTPLFFILYQLKHQSFSLLPTRCREGRRFGAGFGEAPRPRFSAPSPRATAAIDDGSSPPRREEGDKGPSPPSTHSPTTRRRRDRGGGGRNEARLLLKVCAQSKLYFDTLALLKLIMMIMMIMMMMMIIMSMIMFTSSLLLFPFLG